MSVNFWLVTAITVVIGAMLHFSGSAGVVGSLAPLLVWLIIVTLVSFFK